MITDEEMNQILDEYDKVFNKVIDVFMENIEKENGVTLNHVEKETFWIAILSRLLKKKQLPKKDVIFQMLFDFLNTELEIDGNEWVIKNNGLSNLADKIVGVL